MTHRIRLDDLTSDQLDKLYAELDALRQVARGYCPACGRGDAAPTVEDWEQQRNRAEFYEAAANRMRDRAEVAGVHAERAQAALREALNALVHNGGVPPTEADVDRWRAALDQPAQAVTTPLVDRPFRTHRQPKEQP